MALWKITVKRKVNKVGLRLDEGMSVELSTPYATNPLTNNSAKPPIPPMALSRTNIFVREKLGGFKSHNIVTTLSQLLRPMQEPSVCHQCILIIPAPEGYRTVRGG